MQSQLSEYIYLPGAGELITGPTVLGDPMAAGNLICASPPYLTKIQAVKIAFSLCIMRESVTISVHRA